MPIEKIFYDVHMHAMNLSHPHFTAFMERLPLRGGLIANAIPGASTVLSLLGLSKMREVENLLALMDNDLGSFFLSMESCLQHGPHKLLDASNRLVIGSTAYDRIVLTPLIMDFGYKNMGSTKAHYAPPAHLLPSKPVIEQTLDLFRGIRKYRERSNLHLFEIYPFLGLNTANYTLLEIQTMLAKYFDGYTGTRQALSDAYRNDAFDGSIDSIGANRFAGIKVYPPLGFDPWPVANAAEQDKVRALYAFCASKRIPITAHGGPGGFTVGDRKDARTRTAPAKWAAVLAQPEFATLRLNIAHFLDEESWAGAIVDLMKQKTVYADISYMGCRARYYRDLARAVPKLGIPKDRILFGTDFMINLLDIGSYNEYLGIFSETGELSSADKELLASTNPERFLFG